MVSISAEEYCMFLVQLNKTYELIIQNAEKLPSIEDVENLGIKLEWIKKKKDFDFQSEQFEPNETFYIYSDVKYKLVRNLWKGLRDSASHYDLIKTFNHNEIPYYTFRTTSMKGTICKSKWDSFIESLIHISTSK